jgi:3'-5' exoribonuclease
MKKLFIQDIRAGDSVEDIFVLSEKTMAQKRDGNHFLNITLSDKTGNIKGVIWDRVDELSAGTASGDFVQIKGNVSEYKGKLQLVVKNMASIPADSINPSDFLPATPRDIDKMFLRLLKITASMETEHLKKLFEAFFNDMEFVRQFKIAPAAKKMHHAYIGGLLEHTLSMALLGDRISGHYSGVDRDLLLAGVILHDIGKIREFDYKYHIDYSDEGRLVSHVVIGTMMLDEKIQQLEDFPPDQAILLKHMIISHHGTRDFGSPEPPKTIEAVLLNYIDEIDAKVNGIREFMATEDPNEPWTSYHRLLGRHFYRGKED